MCTLRDQGVLVDLLSAVRLTAVRLSRTLLSCLLHDTSLDVGNLFPERMRFARSVAQAGSIQRPRTTLWVAYLLLIEGGVLYISLSNSPFTLNPALSSPLPPPPLFVCCVCMRTLRNPCALVVSRQSYDQHLNMVLGDVEETVTTVEVDEDTYEEIVRVRRTEMEAGRVLMFLHALISAIWSEERQ